MPNLNTQTLPLVASPTDKAWVVFRDFEQNGIVYIESLTTFATVEVASGLTYDPTQLGTVTTLTFNQQGVVQKLVLPVTGGGSPTQGHVVNRATRINPTAGRVKVTFSGMSPFLSFMQAASVSTFGPL